MLLAGSVVTVTCLCVTTKFNFVGRILGPRGLTAKQLEAETGCKIMVRGKGSMRDKKKVTCSTDCGWLDVTQVTGGGEERRGEGTGVTKDDKMIYNPPQLSIHLSPCRRNRTKENPTGHT